MAVNKFLEFKSSISEHGDIERATGFGVPTATILPNMIFFSEKIIHWALCNGIQVENGSISAILYAKRFVNDSKTSVTRTISTGMNAEIVAAGAYRRFGGDASRDLGNADALVADICYDVVFYCNRGWGSLPPESLQPIVAYRKFLIKCAYLMGTKTILNFLSQNRTSKGAWL